MNDHVRSRYLGWREGNELERREVERHLGECAGCRRYYEEMDRLLDPALMTAAPELVPDPFLPERIAGLAAARKQIVAESRSGSVALALQGAVFAAAIAIGILLGLSLQQNPEPGDDEEIVDLYREAVRAEDDAVRFEAVLDDSVGEQQ